MNQNEANRRALEATHDLCDTILRCKEKLLAKPDGRKAVRSLIKLIEVLKESL